jgi:hypothetical protein
MYNPRNRERRGTSSFISICWLINGYGERIMLLGTSQLIEMTTPAALNELLTDGNCMGGMTYGTYHEMIRSWWVSWERKVYRHLVPLYPIAYCRLAGSLGVYWFY